MKPLRIEDDNDVVRFEVPVDLETVAWLMAISESCHAPPAVVIAAMLRNLREDDESAHYSAPPSRSGAATLN